MRRCGSGISGVSARGNGRAPVDRWLFTPDRSSQEPRMALSPACTCLSCPAHPGAGSASAAGAFGLARAGLESVVSWLGGPAAGAAGHGELEDRLLADSREVFRLLLQ